MSTSGKHIHSSQKGVQCEDQVQENPEEPRHSCRSRNPTEKMLELQKDEAQKRERKLSCLYDQWKPQARKARNQLKADIPESQLASLVDTIESAKENVLSMYVEIRDRITPSTEIRRRIDACEAVTRDILKIAYERISGINGDFNSGEEKQRLHELLHHDYALSIYGSSASHDSIHSSYHSRASSVVAKHAEAAANLAVKEAEYKVLLEEEKLKEKNTALRGAAENRT